MPRRTDPNDIRAILRRDPVWSVYALGDLEPGMAAKTLWFAPDLTLVLRDYGTSILFAIGTGSVREALDHVTWPVHLQVQTDALDVAHGLKRHGTPGSATRPRPASAQAMCPSCSGCTATRPAKCRISSFHQW